MSKNKTTIKDVAREAGVSIATVSYVINQRSDIKISDETRKKVLQVINLLDYTPNQAAKALAANRKSLLGVYLPAPESVLDDAEGMYVLKQLVHYFHKNQYEIILLDDQNLEKCDQADAIICYNTSADHFRKLGDNNFIPLLALDCMIHDPLFFQINSDPNRIKSTASTYFNGKSYTYVTLATQNEERVAFFNSAFENVEFISFYEDLKNYSGKNLLLSDHTLYELLKSSNNVCYMPSLTEDKLAKLHECIESALARTPIEQHDVLI